MGELDLALTGGRGMEKLCVVKRVLPHLLAADNVQRFREEAMMVMKLSHGNLVGVLDAGREEGQFYLVMDFVEGRDLLATWNQCATKRVAFPIEIAAYVIKELARGLGYAHAYRDLKLVHRDVSPANVLLSYSGEIKLTDFGLATSRLKEQRTAPGIIYGKLSYLAPEQASGRPLDGRTDLYAAGILLWEMLTGQQLFPKRAPMAATSSEDRNLTIDALERLRNPVIAAPSSLTGRVPAALDAIVLRALATAPADRYQTGEELRADLASFLAKHAPKTDGATLSVFMSLLFQEQIVLGRRDQDELMRQASGLLPETAESIAIPPASEASAADREAEPSTHLAPSPHTERLANPPRQYRLRPPPEPAERAKYADRAVRAEHAEHADRAVRAGEPRGQALQRPDEFSEARLRERTPSPMESPAESPTASPTESPLGQRANGPSEGPRTEYPADPQEAQEAGRPADPAATTGAVPRSISKTPRPSEAPETPKAPRAPASGRRHDDNSRERMPAPGDELVAAGEAGGAGDGGTDDEDRRVGSTIAGRYFLRRLCGEGAMGRVYEGHHVEIGRRVAIKILHSTYRHTPDVVERFRREARAASKIGHPNIVDVTDSGTTPDGAFFFVMEYLDGVDLEQLIARDGQLSIDRALLIAAQVCRALTAAHAAGIIHRDLKPANVMLVRHNDEDDFVKVLDFGISKQRDLDTGPRGKDVGLTRPDAAVGTPIYMAPEQVGGLPVDARTDVYAVGELLFEMLTGAPACSGSDVLAVFNKKANEDPVPVRGLRPDAPVAIEGLLTRAMSRRPADRHETMAELKDEILVCLARLEEAPAPVAGPEIAVAEPSKTRRLSRPRTPTIWITAAGVVAGLGVAALIVSWKIEIRDRRTPTSAGIVDPARKLATSTIGSTTASTAASTKAGLPHPRAEPDPAPHTGGPTSRPSSAASSLPSSLPPSLASSLGRTEKATTLGSTALASPTPGTEATARTESGRPSDSGKPGQQAPRAEPGTRNELSRRSKASRRGELARQTAGGQGLVPARPHRRNHGSASAATAADGPAPGTPTTSTTLAGTAGVSGLPRATGPGPARDSPDPVARGRLAFAKGNFGEAVRLGRTALATGDGLGGHLLLGDAYYKMERFTEAVHEYDAALKAAPGNPLARRGRELAARHAQP